MKYTKTEIKLIEFMEQLDIIDCHEHLGPEKERTESQQDVFTLFTLYTHCDLNSAGMDWPSWKGQEWPFERKKPVYDSLFDYDIPLKKRWEIFKPWWAKIRYGSYARAALLTAKKVYGFDDINDETYQGLSEAIAAENTPGIYKRMLCDRCNIRASLTQCDRTDVERPLVPVMQVVGLYTIGTSEQLEALAQRYGFDVPGDLDEMTDFADKILQKWLDAGAVGIKIISRNFPQVNKKDAEKAFEKLFDSKEPDAAAVEPLNNYLYHRIIDIATEKDLVVAVHAGIWGDFRELDSKYMLKIASAHPQTKFDLYHLGMPSVRDTIVIAKNYPNVFLNLCWSHIISQVQCCSGIDELLDQVPINKVLAFGGDYIRPVEKVVGHLHMARENFAKVFGSRIDRELMSFDQACEILKLWFWDNPLKLYNRLSLE